MPSLASQRTPQRYIADANLHVREAIRCLETARGMVGGEEHELLERLAGGQRQVRRTLVHVEARVRGLQ